MKKDDSALVYDCDVLVIGGGAAGSTAAIEAADRGANVILVEKRKFGFSGASGIHPGWLIAAAAFPKDSTDAHWKDTMRSSGYLSNQKLVRILVEEAPERVLELERKGGMFLRQNDGRVMSIQMGGHSAARSLAPFYLWIIANEVRRRGIKIFEETLVTKLLTTNGNVVGATGISWRNGLFNVFRAKSTVLATGGAGQLYGRGSVAAQSTNPVELTGDGYALAYRAGAEMVDMEFVQFLLGLIYPPQFKGMGLIGPTEKDGCYDRDGVFWMRSIPMKEMTRARFCNEILLRIRMGKGSPHGGIWYDTRDMFDQLESYPKCLKLLYTQFEKAGYNVPEEPVEIYPTAHHVMGGIVINQHCESTMPRLYGCGEATGGVHGANRLGSNSFADCLVFGKRAGYYSAKRALDRNSLDIDWGQVEEEFNSLREIFAKEGRRGLRPFEIRSAVQNLMWNNVSVFKNAEDLNIAVRELERIKKEELPKMYVKSKTNIYNYDLVEAVETFHMLETAEMIARASLLREESRGAHQREDYPETDNKNWLSNIYIRREDSKMILEKRPIITTEIAAEEIIKGAI